MKKDGISWISRHIFTEEYDKTFFDEVKAKDIPLKKDTEIIVYKADNIITMNPMQPDAEAVAVLYERIYAIGSFEDVILIVKNTGIKYSVCDKFKDNVIYPGFIESHSHFGEMAVYFQFYYIGPFKHESCSGEITNGFKTKAEIVEYLKSVISKEKKEIVFAWGYDSTLIEDKDKFLTIDDLDKVSIDIPIIVIDSTGHGIYVNSVTLENVGYDENTTIDGVTKGKNGKPNGVLQELKAIAPVYDKYLNLNEEFFKKGIAIAAKYSVKKGVTTVADIAAGMTKGTLKYMWDASLSEDFPVRIATYIMREVVDAIGGPDEYIKRLKQLKESNNKNFNVNGVKFFIDGSLQIGTALMKWPYYYFAEHNGILNISFDDLYNELKKYYEAGIQCSIHTNGDGAIELAVTAIKHIKRYLNDIESKFRLEHCQTVSETQLNEMAKYNIIPNFYILNLHYWGDYHCKNSIGPIHVKYMNPLKSALRYNLPFALHSDCPVVDMEPLKSVWAAVSRKSLTGVVYGEREKVSVYDALKAVTINAANILGEEEEKGSLEVGKLADMVVLDKNIFECQTDDILNTKVVNTIKGGKVY